MGHWIPSLRLNLERVCWCAGVSAPEMMMSVKFEEIRVKRSDGCFEEGLVRLTMNVPMSRVAEVFKRRLKGSYLRIEMPLLASRELNSFASPLSPRADSAGSVLISSQTR